jgi:NAD(P)-dependent dehydrogenase (short-subunit alcohol dehydrogenase family)
MVTGAGTGIGAETAMLLAETGAKVVIVGRREAPLHEVEQRIIAAGGEVLVAAAVVSDIAQVEKVVEHTLERFGAGENFDLPELPKEVWDGTIAVNCFHYLQHESPGSCY